MKTCPSCKISKPLSDYHPNGKYVQSYCKPCAAVKRKEHYRENPERYKLYQIRYKFGLSEQDYKELYKSQNGLCASCEYELQGRYAVDHDPKSGDICGLLCLNCNIAAGQMWHNPILIRNLADYIERTRRNGNYST